MHLLPIAPPASCAEVDTLETRSEGHSANRASLITTGKRVGQIPLDLAETIRDLVYVASTLPLLGVADRGLGIRS